MNNATVIYPHIYTRNTEWENIPDMDFELTVKGYIWCVMRFWITQNDKTISWIRARISANDSKLISDIRYEDVALNRSNGMFGIEYPFWFEEYPDDTKIQITFQWRVNSVGIVTLSEKQPFIERHYER